MTTIVDMGGNTLITENIRVGATVPGQAGTDISGAELTFLDTASAANTGTNKALITGTSGAVTVAGAATFNANPVIGAGKTIDLDSQTGTLTSNAITATKFAGVITTEALTTAAGAAQAFVITLTGVAAGDLAFVQATGTGTNTRKHYVYEAATTTNTLTVTVNNIGPTNALNGTLIFNYWILKA